MRLYILRWNPAISSYKEDGFYRDFYDLSRRNSHGAEMNWSIYEPEKLDEAITLCETFKSEHDQEAAEVVERLLDEAFLLCHFSRKSSLLFLHGLQEKRDFSAAPG